MNVTFVAEIQFYFYEEVFLFTLYATITRNFIGYETGYYTIDWRLQKYHSSHFLALNQPLINTLNLVKVSGENEGKALMLFRLSKQK
jgi:hypothetical protein